VTSSLVQIMKFLLLGILFFQCDINEGTYSLSLPPGFPEPVIPEDNKLTKTRIQLGKKLFFDPILSSDSSISCASCHFQGKAFSDSIPLSKGVSNRVGFRNAPTLANVAYHRLLLMDGGTPSLETQVLVPIGDHNEMNSSLTLVSKRLKKVKEYVELSKKAYNRIPDPFVIVRAIATYERTLISGNSRVDQYHHNKKATLSKSELRGMELFFSNKTNCSKCHGGFNFSNDDFHNNGLYEEYVDSGRARITMNHLDAGKFKVKTLRNIQLTAPYMHDGSLGSLEEVIDHYMNGGKKHRNQNSLVKGFDITEREKKDLINFLKALTDSTFINNVEFIMQ